MQGTQLDGSCGPCRAGRRDSPDGGAVGLGDPSLDRADGGSQRQSPAGAVRSRANGCLSPDGGARGRRTNRTCAMSPGTGSASAGDSAGASDGRPLGPGHGRIAGAQRPPRGVRMGGDRARATAWTRGRSFGARRSDGRGNAPAAAGQLKDRRVADRPAAAASARPRVLEREAVAVAVEVELRPKAPERLERIVRAWRRARWVGRVRYYAAAGPTTRGVARAIGRARAEQRVELVALEPWLERVVSSSAPDGGTPR